MADTRVTSLMSLTRLKTWLQVSDASDDARLAQIGDAVSARIEQYCNRIFVAQTLTETHDGDGSRRLLLNEYPVVFVSSIAVKATPASSFVTLSQGVDFDLDTSRGRVQLRGTSSASFPVGFQNVLVTYLAGFGPQDDLALPADIYQAALDYCKLVWQELTSGAIAATQINAGNATFILKPSMPWSIKQTLDAWVRRRL
jgi:uncharacterized phiE125 gp8 family phage protein